MIRKLMILPVIYVLSRVVTFVAWVGELINPDPLFAWLFDWIVGREKAEQMREEHKNALVDAVAGREIEYRVSKQVLIEASREQHRDSLSKISRGESIFSISIAIIAVFVRNIPQHVKLPFGLSIPLPSLDTVILSLTVILVASVFLRETAIESQAFDSPSVFDSYEELMTKVAWNGGTLSQSRLVSNIVMLQIMREFDERFYQLYLNLIADYIEQDGLSKREAISRYASQSHQIIQQKWDI